MKKYIKSAIILSAVLSLASCSKADELQNNPDDALQLESVSGISPFSLTTKSVITGNSLPVEEVTKGIGLYVTASDGSAYDGHDKGYSNVNYTYSSDKWSTQTPIYLSNTEGNLYGYFPYNADAIDLAAIPVQSSLNGSDYLYAEPKTVSHSKRQVSLTMNHALSRLHLTIKKGAKFSADATLSKITLTSAAIDATGTMNITTGAVSASKEPSQTGTVEFETNGTITTEGIVKDILLVPADNSESKKGITISLVINGEHTEAVLSAENGIDIRSGIQNNITLTVEDTGVKVEGVGVGIWGEGGEQSVEVKGHKVTVKTADGVDSNDILIKSYVDGNNVIIRAISFQGKGLVCDVGDNANCERTVIDGKFTFIISEISSDIDAVLGYAPTYALTVTSDSNGKVWIGDDETKTSGQFEPGQQVVIHAVPNDKFRLFRWNDNNRETSRTITVGDTDTEYSASFISSDLIPGLFTVEADENGNTTKQVFFSKGNLWCDGTGNNYSNASPKIKSWGFESNQYDSTPKSGDVRSINHISHFFWCKSASESVKETYSETGTTSNDEFFTDNDGFAVNGVSSWRTLGSGEWEYLLDKREGNRFAKAKVHGMTGLLIFPDNYTGTTEGQGIAEVNNSTAGYPSGDNSDIPEDTWTSMQNAGAVFLPAAGFRNGDSGLDFPAFVNGVGNLDGYYWSASPRGSNSAYGLSFSSGSVNPSGYNIRNRAYSVRLVTESK